MPTTLTVPGRDLTSFARGLGVAVADVLDLGHKFLDVERLQSPNGHETSCRLYCSDPKLDFLAFDGKGLEQRLLKIRSGRGWHALLGVSSSWARVRSTSAMRFLDTQIILFVAPAEEERGVSSVDPIQVLRLEWEAMDLNDNFTGTIAHPHWQVDIGRFVIPEATSTFGMEVITSFDAPAPPRNLSWFSRLHLAAGARWMAEPWDENVAPLPHVRGLGNLDELTSWTVSACRYVNQQIAGALVD